MTWRFDTLGLETTWHRTGDYDYPIAQLARNTRTRFQLGFARMTIKLFPDLRDAALEASTEGLRIHATSELALAYPREVVQQIHGDDVAFDEPEVQLRHDVGIEEPIMWVRAVVDRDRMEQAVQGLVGRGAAIEEVDWVAPVPVVRARAPLRRLLGYPQSLCALTQGSAELDMWLSHYEPMPPDPDKAA